MGITLVRLWSTACHRALVVAAALAIAVSASAAGSRYCVQPVNVVAPEDVADLKSKLNSQEPLSDAPDYFDSSKGALYPLIWHYHTVKRPDGLEINHSLFWSFSSNYELVGPRDFFGAFPPVAVDRFGRSLLLGGADEKADSGKIWMRQYARRGMALCRWGPIRLQRGDGGVIFKVDPELQKRIDEPHLVAWSDILDGFVLASTKWRPDKNASVRVGDERSFVLKGDTPMSLPADDLYLNIVSDLPSMGVTALLGTRSLTIVTPQLEATELARLNPGDDYGGFEALHETRDEGWLYVVGGQYDNAVHVEKAHGIWRVTSIVRIAERDGLGFLGWLLGTTRAQMERDKLSKIIRTGTCRKFSTAVKRMFFCDDSNSWANVRSELRAGELVPIAGGAAGLTTFLGDANSLGLALFLGSGRGLYGYDGERVHRIADADFAMATVHDVPKLKRTFLASPNGVFEVRANGRGFELVKLAAPDAGGFFGARFHGAPEGDATIVFVGKGIYLLKDDALTPIWPSMEYGIIDTSGGMPPTDVIGWKGILFTTHAGKDRRFHLLRSCS